jgi:hypothetical protein
MNPTNYLTRVMLKIMNMFQKMNNTKGRCIDNVLFLCDTLKHHGIYAKAKAVIVCYEKNECDAVCHIHLVVETNEGIIDPSYELDSMKLVAYCDQFCNAKKQIEFNFNFEESPHLLKTLMHTTLTNFLRFQKIANTINEETFTISNYEYYKEQATFVKMIVYINKIKWDSYGNECI